MIIITKYLGPTDTKGSRIRASFGRKSKTVPYDYAIDNRENHERAASALASWEWLVGRWFHVGSTDTGMMFSRTVNDSFVVTGHEIHER